MEPIDDFVFSHLGEFDGKKLVSADRADLKLPETGKEKKEDEADRKDLDKPVADSLLKWMKELLGDRVKEVKSSDRLVDSPAIIVNPDAFMTSSMERIMQAQGKEHSISAKNLEINTSHPLIAGLADMRIKDENFAKNVVEQVYDNALIQAGLMVEPRNMVARSYEILERALQK
jgi:molecular chaperone HtpG